MEMIFGLIALSSLAFAALWLWGLFDATRQPAESWDRAGYSRLVTILMMLFFSVIGTLVYLLAIRPKLTSPSGSGAGKA
ncbi:MAG TPA: hypothetical protein VGL92_17950, partial [Acidimicrobiia bacterium]